MEEDFLADVVAEEEGVETTSWLNTHDEGESFERKSCCRDKCVAIDQCTLASFAEIEEMLDGVH